MGQERAVQATIFEVFAGHEIGCELKAISQWLDQLAADEVMISCSIAAR